MESLYPALITSVWLGILTSISPCPLATNIAAVSFIGRRVGKVRSVLLSGIVYALGRMLAYISVGSIVVAGLLSVPTVSNVLQRYMVMFLGPLLIVTGMFLLEMISLKASRIFDVFAPALQKAGEKNGVLGAGLLGFVFALSFCPVSAALFFGSLVPLSVKHGSILLMPSLYGLGTGLPVLGFAFVIAVSAHSVGAVFNKLTVFELWARKLTGIVFIATGLYMSLKYIFQIF